MIRSHTKTTPEGALDMRRPGIVKGTILPVTRRPIDNMIVHPTST